MFTYSGVSFDPFNPDPELIDIYDIANALSHIGRFGGHAREFLSVAEHSIKVFEQVSPENGKWALLHDASEAYLGDIPAPLKYHDSFAFYRDIEKEVMRAICYKFELPYEEPEEVKYFDMVVRVTEMRDFTNIPNYFFNGYEPLDSYAPVLEPQTAKELYIHYAMEIGLI
jgi:hypothetical protein